MFWCSTYFSSQQEWLFYRLRSGFGLQCYVTWFMGRNGSITYENVVQIGVTVVRGRQMQTAVMSMFSGSGLMCTIDRYAPEWFFTFYIIVFLPISFCSYKFSPRLSISVNCMLFSRIPWCYCYTLILPLPCWLSPKCYTTTQTNETQTDRQTDFMYLTSH